MKNVLYTDEVAKLEIDKELKYLTPYEQQTLVKIINIVYKDSKTMPAIKNAIQKKETLFMIFIIVGKRKLFNLNETRVSVLYNIYVTHLRQLGFKDFPLYQNLNEYFNRIDVDMKIFNQTIKELNDKLISIKKPNMIVDTQNTLDEIGNKVTQRVTDPDGNEHKIVFVKTADTWEIE